ncbi:MAG: DUF6709 family protein [Lachnotalea sp.]
MKKQLIAKTIRKIYLAKLLPALLFIAFTIIIFIKYPISEILLPNQLDNVNNLVDSYQSGQKFVNINVPSLYYTGYDCKKNSIKIGSYYYSIINDKCVFFLLTNKTSNNAALELTDVTIKSKLVPDVKHLDFLSSNFASDLSWTSHDFNKITCDFIVSDLDSFVPISYALLIFMSVIDLYSIVSMIFCLTFIIAPQFSPICKHLGNGKSTKKALHEVDLELKGDRYFYVSDMSITSNYFIEIGKYHAEIIPLNNIIWAYKHSNMSKFFGISYTLIIYSNHNVSRFKHKQKYDVDFILEYLEENCPNIIIGNTKEHKILAMEQFKMK